MSQFIRAALVLLALYILLSVVSPTSPAIALADAPYQTLTSGARAAYRFDYKGDRTRIEVALDAQGIAGVVLYIYTPAQIQAAGQGQDLIPIARGTPNSGHDAFWSGAFPAPGVYQIAVVNQSPGVVLYRLSITGESVSGVASMSAPPPAPDRANLAANRLTVSLPPGADRSVLSLAVPGAPADCTHAYAVSGIISSSIKLCANEIYPPLHVIGSGVAIYGDATHSAVVTSGGRQFAVTVEGSYNLVEGLTVQAGADAADLGAWLCQYDECIFPTQPRRTVINGGLIYGGGILLKGSYSVVHGVTVHGGTIGVATVNGTGNAVLDNQLNDLNGWGSFNIGSVASYYVGNSLDRENHGCTTPDGYKFLHGCETAGWVCLGCQNNVVARNHCAGSANCFYMSGERGLASNHNRLLANYCAGATDNCFELTFSQGNLLRDNITTSDPVTGAACKYPFWIGGSTVYFQGNSWQCGLDADKALADAVASTTVPTIALDTVGPSLSVTAAPSVPSVSSDALPVHHAYVPAE
ncbi:MAG: hypothetical protein WCF84_22110 [Anaerolineae bacterium]